MYRDNGEGGEYIHTDSLPTSSHLGAVSEFVSLSEIGNQYEYSNLVTGRSYHFYLSVCNAVGCSNSNVLGPVPIASVPGKPPSPSLISSAATPVAFLELKL